MTSSSGESEWRELGDGDSDNEIQIEEYDLSSVPNDFNILTIFNFIETGAVVIPGFQRNYVWELPRASKLIESLILGLPVPQVFLYETGRNEFLVIDGQQRLMTIYFFMKGRFPKRQKRGLLRSRTEGLAKLEDSLFADDDIFQNFRLKLPKIDDEKENRFNGLSYQSLGDYKTQFELRTIRNIVVKQLHPSGDDSSIYEMFHRLNSGGANLTAQEIRSSLYYSSFLEMLHDVNLSEPWRELLKRPDPDLHLRDLEILLRATAMHYHGSKYSSSMAKFLNRFSSAAKDFDDDQVQACEELLRWFIGKALEASKGNDGQLFFNRNGRFSVTAFEAAFAASASWKERNSEDSDFPVSRLALVTDDAKMVEFAAAGSSHKSNVAGRLVRAGEIVQGT